MDDCKRFKDLILTDHLDAETDLQTRQAIDLHLQSCADCRGFTLEAERNLVNPFKNAERQQVPAHLWSSIQERLERKSTLAERFRNHLDSWIESSLLLRLAPMAASLVLFLLIGTISVHNLQVKQIKDKEQAEYLVSVLASVTSLPEGDSGLGTPIEQYFL